MSRTRTLNYVLAHPGSGSTVFDARTYETYRYFTPQGRMIRDIGVTTVPVGQINVLTPGKTGRAESITDERTSPGRFNAVTHSKELWDCPLKPVTMIGSCNKPGVIVTTTGYAGAADSVSYGIDTVPFMATDDQMLAEASSSINPRIVRPLFDIAQQVGEFIELYKGWEAVEERMMNVAQELKRLNRINSPVVRKLLGQRTFDQLSMRDWATLAVSADLGYQFAYKPTVQMVRDYLKTQKKVVDDATKYFSSEQVLHGVSRRDSSASSSFTGYPNYYYYWGNTRTYTKEVHATVRVKYRTPETLANRLKIYTALWGVYPHVDTLWELYPLSFIVDFFADFGSVLKQWAEVPIDAIQYDVLESGWSVKTTATSEGWIDLCAGTDRSAYRSVQPNPLVTGKLIKTNYKREPKVLDLNSFTPRPLHIRLPDANKMKSVAEVAIAIKLGYRKVLRVLM